MARSAKSDTRIVGGRILVAALIFVAACLAGPAASSAGEVTTVAGAFHFNVKVKSLKEARFRNVIRQRYDFSCGSAAVATLLSYHYDRATAEQEVFSFMWERGDQEAIKTRGFSLLDMKRFLEAEGFGADGYQAPLSKLKDVGIPAIVLINLRGYLHFVVVKGVTDDEVLVGDPAVGLKIYPRDEFEKMWNGILFVVTNSVDSGRQHFNQVAEWRSRRPAPLGLALSRESLSAVTLLLPGPNEF